MAGYSPLKITGNQTGLVKSREEFILPNDAYPTLQNAYVWRERILRKRGLKILGRLQRQVTVTGNLTAGSANLISLLGLQSSSNIVAGSINITVGGNLYTDPAQDGNLLKNGVADLGSTINYATTVLTIAGGGAGALTGTIQYYPNLPVMGIRTQDQQNDTNANTIFFDQVYAYEYNPTTGAFEEYLPLTNTTWNAHNGDPTATDFFWSTNYWVSDGINFGTNNEKLFWVVNNTGQYGGTNQADPPRITDGATWLNWYSVPAGVPGAWTQIDATNFLFNWASMLPYRGRMVVFNTWEGATVAQSQQFSNRVRWSTIGNPFIAYSAGPPATGSWRDDIRGQGGFLDIPTSEDIVAVGFVRDNLVIYCERSTWQLRYTGRSIAPFQIERVNSELGAEGEFSAVQFDTSLVGIGDKGIVECDSYQSKRIDIKIPDFVFAFNSDNNGPARVHGIRDFVNRLAYWTVPLENAYDPQLGASNFVFPNRRLVYNYENDSWALFTDSLTALGTFQPQQARTWLTTDIPWVECDFTWKDSQPAQIPSIVGGNQQGFVHYISTVDITTSQPSLYIQGIANSTTTIITCPNHNLFSTTGSDSINNVPYVIGISGIPDGTPYSSLNGGVYGISVIDQDTFEIYSFDTNTQQFSGEVTASPSGTYVGGGLINLRDNFSIVSKKFNFLDDGQSIQLGYLDILMDASGQEQPGAITLKVFLDYDDSAASNTSPNNEINDYSVVSNPDTFFNSVIPTTQSTLNNMGSSSKFWQRVFCATRANFLTLQYTFSNSQLNGEEQELPVQIDAQVLWIRKAGRMTQI